MPEEKTLGRSAGPGEKKENKEEERGGENGEMTTF